MATSFEMMTLESLSRPVFWRGEAPLAEARQLLIQHLRVFVEAGVAVNI